VADILVVRGPDRGKRFVLDYDLSTIGRSLRTEVRLVDTEVSRRHAQLRRDNDHFLLLDLGSSNGTFLNGKRVEQSNLRSRDRIQIGQTVMVFRDEDGAVATSPELAEQVAIQPAEDVTADDASRIVKAVDHEQAARLLQSPDSVESPWLKTALANLAVLYQTTHAISHIFEIDSLLDKILDLIFSVIEADRGCIMLLDEESEEMVPRATRFRNGRREGEQISVSHTIVSYVAEQREGVLTANAMSDERFQSGESVVKHGIRSALCVPLLGRQELLGTIYVDTRISAVEAIMESSTGKRFSEDHLKLLIAIAHLAAMAVENSRYYMELLRTERLAAVGETIATLSHHIKNIMQGIRAGSYLIDSGLKGGDNQVARRGWNVVEKNQAKIYNMVMDMLSYSKDRQPALSPTDPNQVVADVVELMVSRAREVGVSLQAEPDTTLPPILMDADGVHRVVLNLVTNALDATESKGGVVTVTTHLSPSREHVVIDVVDDGTGIPEDELPAIFNVFSSTKGSKGTGLGLAVARKIVREHGGDIHVTSRPGAGSTFSILLPARTHLHPDPGPPTELASGDTPTP